MKGFSWDSFMAVPLIGILRGFDGSLLPGIIHSCIVGGLTTIEVTMNSPDASGQIRAAIKLAGDRLNIGAGTVLDLGSLQAALAVGASFIVTPAFSQDVVRACVARNIPVFPGVFSPTEIVRALDLGANWVKLFPAEALGMDYLKAIKGSVPAAKLLPTGGVSLETLPGLIQAGADGFGIGSPLFAPDRIRAEDWSWLENRCRAFVHTYQRNRLESDR